MNHHLFIVICWLCEASKHRPAEEFAMRISCLFVLLLLALLPVIAFAIAGYMALSLIQPTENIGLVAIVWINAAAIVHVIMAINRFFFAPPDILFFIFCQSAIKRPGNRYGGKRHRK